MKYTTFINFLDFAMIDIKKELKKEYNIIERDKIKKILKRYKKLIIGYYNDG